VNVFADTSVWSLALRRDTTASSHPAVGLLARYLKDGEAVYTSGLVLQELLQGFRGPKQRELILRRFSILPFIVPTREDHIEAAELRNRCRRKGVQIGTIDALLAQLCLSNDLLLLTADDDFVRLARYAPLRLPNHRS
jgi:predicted nucleic acid-binding protein